MPPRKKKSLSAPAPYRKHRLPETEHGDWRVPLTHPEEAEHYYNPSVSLWRRLNVRAEYLQSADTQQWLQAAEASEDWEFITGWRRALHMAVGILLMPVSIVLVFALLVQLYHSAPVMSSMSFWLSEPVWYTIMGILLFIFLKMAVVANDMLVWVYVLGHELTHAIAAKLCGGHLHGLSVDRSGGYLETDADNFFIALAPYFVPLWMLVWLAVLALAHLIYPFEAYGPWFYAGFGFWWTFHLYWTAWIIPREQPDMLSNGIVLSTMVILIANILVLLGVMWCLGALSLAGYWQDLCLCSHEIGDMLTDITRWVMRLW